MNIFESKFGWQDQVFIPVVHKQPDVVPAPVVDAAEAVDTLNRAFCRRWGVPIEYAPHRALTAEESREMHSVLASQVEVQDYSAVVPEVDPSVAWAADKEFFRYYLGEAARPPINHIANFVMKNTVGVVNVSNHTLDVKSDIL